MSRTDPIGFIGLSHLGLVSSLAAASKGHSIVAFDVAGNLCQDLCEGRLPVSEPGLAALLKENVSRIEFTNDPARLALCELIYFSCDIQTDKDNRSDLSVLQKLIEQIANHLKKGATLVILSQVPPGFTRNLRRLLFEKYKDKAFEVFYQVETLIFGRAVERAISPERLIVGSIDLERSLPKIYADFLKKFDCPLMVMGFESAELAKIAINVCLCASLTAANTLAEICEVVGADWSQIVPALRLDKRIGPYAYLEPGLGIGGGNLERDLMTVKSLAAEWGTEAVLAQACLVSSDYRRDWALKIIHREVLSQHKTPLIAIWGLAYKSGTHSIKNSPAVSLIENLKAFSVQVYDPQVYLEPKLSHVTQLKSALGACQKAQVLVVMTPWEEFSKIDLVRVREEMPGRVIIDPFGALDKKHCLELGFSYFRLGLPLSSKERAK